MNNINTSDKLSRLLSAVYYPFVSLFAAFSLCAILIGALGFQPLSAYANLIRGAFGDLNAWSETLVKATPVIFTGLSYAIAKRCGLINLGAAGQLSVGALGAAFVATNFETLPAIVHFVFVLTTGFFFGFLYGASIGIMKTKFQASELITTIMLNYIALHLISYFISGPMKDVASGSLPQSKAVDSSIQFARFFQGSRLHTGIFIMLLAIFFYYIFFWKTTKGYELRVIGYNPSAGEYAGMNIEKNSTLAMALAGGIAGLGGAVELLSIQTRLTAGFAMNYGFDGIAVALLGNNHPVGIFFSGILFGSLSAGAGKMETLSHVPSAVIYMIQGIIILFVIGRELFHCTIRKKKKEEKDG